MSKTQTWATHFVGEAQPQIQHVEGCDAWLIRSHGSLLDIHFDDFSHLCRWHDRIGALIQAEHREANYEETSHFQPIVEFDIRKLKERDTSIVMKALSLYAARANQPNDLDARDAVLEELGL